MSDNLNITRDARAADSTSARNEFTRTVEKDERVGRLGLPRGRGHRLWAYDRLEGAKKSTSLFASDKADRMPVAQAAELMKTLHVTFGVDRQMEGFLYDFDRALFLCYALNGGSQLTPSQRVQFFVGSADGDAYANAYDYATVHTVLGVDFRRFFRAFANEVVDSCRAVIESCDFENPDSVEMREQLRNLAQARGIARFPHMVADCADAATNISTNELHAAITSAALVIGNTTNSVDKRNTAVPIRSSDNYDSSVGASVSNGNDVHARAGYYA